MLCLQNVVGAGNRKAMPT